MENFINTWSKALISLRFVRWSAYITNSCHWNVSHFSRTCRQSKDEIRKHFSGANKVLFSKRSTLINLGLEWKISPVLGPYARRLSKVGTLMQGNRIMEVNTKGNLLHCYNTDYKRFWLKPFIRWINKQDCLIGTRNYSAVPLVALYQRNCVTIT